MDKVAHRISRTAESFLENEALTDNLNDEAAQVLLEWAMAQVEQIASLTFGLNDEQAEEIMYPRLKALRRLMRWINKSTPQYQQQTEKERLAFLKKITEQAQIVYGKQFEQPSQERQQTFATTHFDSPTAFIQALHDLFEQPDQLQILASLGEKHEQEEE